MLLTVRKNDVEGIFQYQNNNISIILLGSFYCKDRECSYSEILSCYESDRERLHDCLDGCGVVIVVDRNIDRIYICSDFLNSPYYLFYTIRRDKICFSDSIFDLAEEFRPNDRAVREFLIKGCVGGEHTTLDGVYKLPPKSYMTLNISNLELKIHPCKYSRLRKKVSLQSYNTDMADCVRGCYSYGAGCALSSGFDSNFILHHIHRHNDTKPIDAFCVGGALGENEIDESQQISNEYSNVKFHSALVDSGTLRHYPEIVCALNGQVFERGIFLQYELAKMLSEHGIENCLLGECADQICSYDLYHRISVSWIRISVRHLFGKGLNRKSPYQYAAQVILKKSGMMMRHFNITPRYPYIRKCFMDTQFSVAHFFSSPKQVHKAFVTATVKDSIALRLQKHGGATDNIALVNENLKMVINKLATESRWFDSRLFANTKNPSGYLLSILYMEIFEKMFRKEYRNENTTLEKLFPEFGEYI